MFKIKCFLPNASDSINGIAFSPCEDGGVESVDAVSEEDARQFEGIQGYALIPSEPTKARKGKAKEE
jgi:hypothetical protein